MPGTNRIGRGQGRPGSASVRPGDGRLADRLRGELQGEVLFDPVSRGQYSTDASIYQIEPLGVVVARTAADIERAVAIAREEGVPVLPRGAGTSQCGQTVGEALVIDVGKHLNQVLALDETSRRVKVQPGIVLDELNAWLKPKGLFFPVDVSPANRATIGGMTGNNSCGSRSIRYGNMVHNVNAIDAILADGTKAHFGWVPGNPEQSGMETRYLDLVQRLRVLHAREAEEIEARFPKLLRRVGGYNIDSISAAGHNMAHMLVGSEGTLAFFTEVELDLHRLPAHKALGICHFPTFYAAMQMTQHIVTLHPSAVELVDRTLMELSRDIEMFRPTLERFVQGDPDALLLVEFAGEDRQSVLDAMARLGEMMADHGFPGAVVEAIDTKDQREVWDVRKAGLNIMMSMKGDGKPISFIEDCAVSLEDLAEYTRRLDEVFAKYGTTGTWYAHASVGTLHVRPIVNLKEAEGARKMRAIAEEAFEMVREYKGSHSGEHGDGLVRSEFHEAMFGTRMTDAFREVKTLFDPEGLLNPGKIVDPPRMDERELFRYRPGYAPIPMQTSLDWSEWGGFSAAVEMCNNNGTCRKSNPGVMCPSYRLTRDEKHLTRGRANALRLALTGQLGADALTSDALYDTMDLCVGCKGCKRECPTGVDMARMKIEFTSQYQQRHGLKLTDRLIAYLPRLAPRIAGQSWVSGSLNWLQEQGWARHALEKLLRISAKRSLPRWHAQPFGSSATDRPTMAPAKPGSTEDGTRNPESEVVLWVDTFNRWFEPENARAALVVLEAAGYRVHLAEAPPGERPLCCGRTFLSAGLVDRARLEAERIAKALGAYADRGVPILGLEPSCLLSLRDEFTVLLPAERATPLAEQALLLEEFISSEVDAGRWSLPLRAIEPTQALLHGHCHQKAFGAMSAVEKALALVPGLEVDTVASSCCGMAGAFGYQAEHYALSMQMAEMDLLPAVRDAGPDTLLVADGTSCRHQIADGTGRKVVHVAQVLERALARH